MINIFWFQLEIFLSTIRKNFAERSKILLEANLKIILLDHQNNYIHGKNNFAEGSKILLDVDLKINLLDHQNKHVGN